jgi:hypothetical protein
MWNKSGIAPRAYARWRSRPVNRLGPSKALPSLGRARSAGVELTTGRGIALSSHKPRQSGGLANVSPEAGFDAKTQGKAMPVLGAAGLLALASGASVEAPVDTSTPNTGVSHQIFLGEEEISDVSLATFYVLEAGSLKPGVQLARDGGCGCGHGCGGGGGCRGCRGCGRNRRCARTTSSSLVMPRLKRSWRLRRLCEFAESVRGKDY